MEKSAGANVMYLGFRETFSRPVRRIRFLGLFDTGPYSKTGAIYGN